MNENQPPLLTSEEHDLLEPYLDQLIALAEGGRDAKTDEQRHFQDACRNLVESNSEYERVFLKWRRREQWLDERPPPSKLPPAVDGEDKPHPGADWIPDEFHWRNRRRPI